MTWRRAATLLGALSALALLGCSTPGPPSPAHAQVAVPVRDVLLQGEKEAADLGAYGYLLFASQPAAENQERYLAACEAFRGKLEERSLIPAQRATRFMVTYWLLSQQAEDDCEHWLESYDYPRAHRILSQAGLLDREGPVLMAWTRPPDELPVHAEGLVLDLSPSRVSEKDYGRALRAWRAAIVEEPAVWESGLRFKKAQFYMANALEDAPMILAALGEVFWAKE